MLPAPVVKQAHSLVTKHLGPWWALGIRQAIFKTGGQPRIVALTISLCAGVGCGQVNQYVPPPPPEVTVAQPTTDQVSEYLEFTGTTQATDRVQIRARVNGYLQSIEFEDGATVKQGDLLFVIEPAPFEAALASAKAALQKAEAMLKLAQAEVRRTTPLVKRGALPEQELDIKEADRATAEADVASAKATLVQAELNVGYSRVLAPISGRIGRHMVDVGNLVQAETTILTTIESYDPIYAHFNVSEGDVLRLTELSFAEEAAAGSPAPAELSMALGNDEGFPHKGILDFADLGIDPSTGTQLRRGVFQNPGLRLVPGLFVRLRLPVGMSKPELLIGERAIGQDQRGEYVLVVNDKDEVEYRPVKLGLSIQGLRVVKQGIQPGEWVVVNGLQRARPGSKVKPQRAEEMAERPETQNAAEPAKKPATPTATTAQAGE